MKRVKRKRAAATAASVVALLVLAAVLLTTSHHHNSGIQFVGGSTAAPTVTAAASGIAPQNSGAPVRWWSSPAGKTGSVLDVEQPERAAAGLAPDTTAYCAMLKSSMSSPLNPLGAPQRPRTSDLVISTRAWLAELEALSGGAVAEAWKTMGPSFLSAISPGQSESVASPEIDSAISVISIDANDRCHLDLSRPQS